jgi:hypothetical protein
MAVTCETQLGHSVIGIVQQLMTFTLASTTQSSCSRTIIPMANLRVPYSWGQEACVQLDPSPSSRSRTCNECHAVCCCCHHLTKGKYHLNEGTTGHGLCPSCDAHASCDRSQPMRAYLHTHNTQTQQCLLYHKPLLFPAIGQLEYHREAGDWVYTILFSDNYGKADTKLHNTSPASPDLPR